MSKTDLSEFTPDVRLRVLADTHWDDNPAMQAALNDAAEDMAMRRNEREGATLTSTEVSDIFAALLLSVAGGLALAAFVCLIWLCVTG